jgi:hypothetical protein
MSRLRDWQERLEALIASRIDAPFAWGVNDCCLFAADAVFAMTGHDPAADARGTYSDERSAMRVLRDMGGLEGIASTRAGGEEISPMRARVGDVVLGKLDRECLGICGGATWHGPGADGLVSAPMTAALKAWRV